MAGSTTTPKKAERKYLAHYIDASFGGSTANYVRLGKDLEEYNIELNPDVETKKNILGENSVIQNGYEVQAEVDPYYYEYDDALSEKIAEIANGRLLGDANKTTAVDVLIDSAGTVEWAYREDVYVVPKSIGGDTSGVQIPFTVFYAGHRVKGTFNNTTNSFTEVTGS